MKKKQIEINGPKKNKKVTYSLFFSGSVTNALLGACLLKATKNVTVALIICAMTGFSRLFWIWNITGLKHCCSSRQIEVHVCLR